MVLHQDKYLTTQFAILADCDVIYADFYPAYSAAVAVKYFQLFTPSFFVTAKRMRVNVRLPTLSFLPPIQLDNLLSCLWEDNNRYKLVSQKFELNEDERDAIIKKFWTFMSSF